MDTRRCLVKRFRLLCALLLGVGIGAGVGIASERGVACLLTALLYSGLSILPLRWLFCLGILGFSLTELSIPFGALTISGDELVLYAILPLVLLKILALKRAAIHRSAEKAVRCTVILTLLLLVSSLRAPYQTTAIKACFGLFQWIILWSSLIVGLRGVSDAELLMQGFVAVATIGCLRDTVSLITSPRVYRIHGVFGDANFWGAFLWIPFVYLVTATGSARKRTVFRMLAALIMVDGLLTGSRAFLVTGAFVFWQFVWLRSKYKVLAKRKRLSYGLFAALVLLGFHLIAAPKAWEVLSSLYRRDLEARLQVYMWAVHNFPRYYAIGLGPENMPLLYDRLAPFSVLLEHDKTSHNMYIQMAVSGGLFALMSYLGMLVSAVRTARRGLSGRTPVHEASGELSVASATYLSLVAITIEGLFLDLGWSGWVWVLYSIPFIIAKGSGRTLTDHGSEFALVQGGRN